MATTPNPFDLPIGPMSKPELEAWILFGIAVAGKTAKTTEKKMEHFYSLNSAATPFAKIRSMVAGGDLSKNLKRAKLGKYTLLNKAYRAVLQMDLESLTVAKLEAIPGIGPKTARMILMYAFPGTEYAVLDTHVLKWLATQGHQVPSTTPSGSVYSKLENIVLSEAKKRGMSARELDTWIWKQYARQ